MPCGPRASGSAPRCSWRPTARSVAARPPSPVSPPRSRRSTPTRWSTTICPAWTTTTCVAAGPPPIARSTWPPPPGSGFLLVPVAARLLAVGAGELGLSAATLGRMAAELFQAGGIEGMVGGQWLDLEAERRELPLPELIAVHRGKTGALIRAACTLGGMAAEAGPGTISPRSPPTARTSGSPSRSPTTSSTPPAPARSSARPPAATPSWPSPPTSVCSGWTAPGGRPRPEGRGHLERRVPSGRCALAGYIVAGLAPSALGALAGYIVYVVRSLIPGG